ncbi:hypothetical protein [Sharpea azabuensis]|uniref:hypothetical protein n=1 Tax=Sharpea azabuensis TaxID=322505 RepID=UPI00156841AE|nr:hypothetical protein [Sharpea azabuensis]
MTSGEAFHLLSPESGNMQEDCLNLIMNEIGNQWGNTLEQLKKDPVANPFIINNSFIFLSTYFCGYEELFSKVAFPKE